MNGDELGPPFFEAVPNNLKDERDDTATHQSIWNYFTRLIPLEARDFLAGYSIVTDGSGNVLAAVGQSTDDPEQWILEVDIVDSTDEYILTFSLLH